MYDDEYCIPSHPTTNHFLFLNSNYSNLDGSVTSNRSTFSEQNRYCISKMRIELRIIYNL